MAKLVLNMEWIASVIQYLWEAPLVYCTPNTRRVRAAVEIFAFAEFCLWVGVYAVTGIVLPLVGLKGLLCKTLHNA